MKFGPLLVPMTLMLLVSSANAEPNSVGRVQAFAALPDWTGLWESRMGARTHNPSGHTLDADGVDDASYSLLAGHPPLNAKEERKFQTFVSNGAAPAAAAASAKVCVARFPLVMDWARMFQVAITPEETLIVFEDGTVRHIYTDGRSHPGSDDLWPTPMGDSVGHWERETLVIDTVAATPGRPIGLGPNELSEQAHFTERMRLIDKNRLEDQLTIDDPLRLIHPWTLTIRYSRVTNLNRMLPWDCGADRDVTVNGKMTISPR